jgi:hypothetical protein
VLEGARIDALFDINTGAKIILLNPDHLLQHLKLVQKSTSSVGQVRMVWVFRTVHNNPFYLLISRKTFG